MHKKSQLGQQETWQKTKKKSQKKAVLNSNTLNLLLKLHKPDKYATKIEFFKI